MRIFTATLATETNTFAPMPTGLTSYKERGYLSASRDHHWTIHNRQFLANRCG